MLCKSEKNGEHFPTSGQDKASNRVDSLRNAAKIGERERRKTKRKQKQVQTKKRHRIATCSEASQVHLCVSCNAKKIGESFPLLK
jgi:hypothetical protein